jgi:hypothetical protein
VTVVRCHKNGILEQADKGGGKGRERQNLEEEKINKRGYNGSNTRNGRKYQEVERRLGRKR